MGLKFWSLLVGANIMAFTLIVMFVTQKLGVKPVGQQLLFDRNEVLGVSDVAVDDVRIDMVTRDDALVISSALFGGAHNPKLEDVEIWKQVDEAGVTGLRKDFFLERMFPKGVTLDGYRMNLNQIQEVSTWNKEHIDEMIEIYKRAQDFGWEVTGIVAYSPPWLNVNKNKEHALPTDWDVYEDIVGKAYRIYRPYLDKVEIWNEPDVDSFLDRQNSNLTKEEAYVQIFLHASRAIRKVDRQINDGRLMPIGGPAIADSRNNQPLKAVLANQEARGYLNFVSYHDYEQHQNSWRPIQEILSSENLDLPVYVTEWSRTFNIKESTPEIMTERGITYTANKLISYATAGIAGANYFALQPIEPNSAWGNVGFLGFYMDDNKALLPLHRTWNLMSRTLGLGVKSGSLLHSTNIYDLRSMAFINSAGVRGYVVSNATTSDRRLSISLENMASDSFIRVNSYLASKSANGLDLTDSQLVRGNAFELHVPAGSVVGLKFEEIPWINYQMRRLINQIQR